jgi:large conductance mechanosensitive channel
MWQDFKKFIMRGNVLDLAVAVIIGGAFRAIISSFVDDIIMPVIGILVGKVDFTTLQWVISKTPEGEVELAVKYGMFIQNIIDFLIIAFAIFIIIRVYEKTKKKPEPKPEEPKTVPEDVKLLTEIRDLLQEKK